MSRRQRTVIINEGEPGAAQLGEPGPMGPGQWAVICDFEAPDPEDRFDDEVDATLTLAAQALKGTIDT